GSWNRYSRRKPAESAWVWRLPEPLSRNTAARSPLSAIPVAGQRFPCGSRRREFELTIRHNYILYEELPEPGASFSLAGALIPIPVVNPHPGFLPGITET